MPKRLGSSEVIRVLQEHGFFFSFAEGQPRQIQARHRTHRHRAGSEERTSHRHHPLHHSLGRADAARLWVLTSLPLRREAGVRASVILIPYSVSISFDPAGWFC